MSESLTLNARCCTYTNYLVLGSLITETGDTVVTDTGYGINLVTINMT